MGFFYVSPNIKYFPVRIEPLAVDMGLSVDAQIHDASIKAEAADDGHTQQV